MSSKGRGRKRDGGSIHGSMGFCHFEEGGGRAFSVWRKKTVNRTKSGPQLRQWGKKGMLLLLEGGGSNPPNAYSNMLHLKPVPKFRDIFSFASTIMKI